MKLIKYKTKGLLDVLFVTKEHDIAACELEFVVGLNAGVIPELFSDYRRLTDFTASRL